MNIFPCYITYPDSHRCLCFLPKMEEGLRAATARAPAALFRGDNDELFHFQLEYVIPSVATKMSESAPPVYLDPRSSKGLHLNKNALVLKDMIVYFILWFSICSKSYPFISLLPGVSLSRTMVDCFLSGLFHSRSPSSCGCGHSVSAGSLSRSIPLSWDTFQRLSGLSLHGNGR